MTQPYNIPKPSRHLNRRGFGSSRFSMTPQNGSSFKKGATCAKIQDADICRSPEWQENRPKTASFSVKPAPSSPVGWAVPVCFVGSSLSKARARRVEWASANSDQSYHVFTLCYHKALSSCCATLVLLLWCLLLWVLRHVRHMGLWDGPTKHGPGFSLTETTGSTSFSDTFLG